MADELTELAARAQQPSMAVTTSVADDQADVARTAGDQQRDRGDDDRDCWPSREIFATSRDLLRTMNEVAGVAELLGDAAGVSWRAGSREWARRCAA